MPKKWYYSKTRWRQQPRDANGRWTSGVGGAARKAARFALGGTTWDRGAEVNFANQSATGGLSATRKLLGGYKMVGSIGLSIQPSNRSPMERLVGAATDAAARKLAGGAGSLFRLATGKAGDKDGKTTVAGVRVQTSPGSGLNPFGSVRTVTRKQMARERRSAAKAEKKASKRAARNGVPSTITAGRPQRRSVHNEIGIERKAARLRGGVSPSRVVGGTKKKSKKKSAGTYTR